MVVSGYDVWQTRVAGDPNIVGRVVQVGASRRTVVGVMPEGFAFPVFHSLRLPLRVSERLRAPSRPSINIFGRFAPGTIPAGSEELVAQFGLGRRRLAAGIPFTENVQRLLIVEREAAYEPTAHAEGVHVSVFAGDCGGRARKVSAHSPDRIEHLSVRIVRRQCSERGVPRCPYAAAISVCGGITQHLPVMRLPTLRPVEWETVFTMLKAHLPVP